MYRVLAIGALTLATLTAQAHSPHGPNVYHQHRYYGSGNDWVAPAILGGLVVYAATRPAVVQPPPPACGPWVEIRNADGTVTQSRTCQ